eukprot:m.11802 g.11802  ORF g.11802 m.11802 type:complete len:79 (+) comp6670_c0_seq1:504-740(+)
MSQDTNAEFIPGNTPTHTAERLSSQPKPSKGTAISTQTCAYTSAQPPDAQRCTPSKETSPTTTTNTTLTLQSPPSRSL